ncbi:MAG TPA: iron-sulfur cluster assembly protein [Intrasporangium sp.]|uniref:metal-sulfur cluster assembly factor n=1 Tax=Intrasporangium sp. TaxID=1925024 RepID=UPI002D7835F7|nr:iron-sulfur cluster assembly protein [Intrasporangium sp.]HET7398582.1 iron-sulfur cluster assembly protein [Intrasporangium sp.]
MSTISAPTVDPRISDLLKGVYDPCCRDKGISVVDMGLLHSAGVDDDGTARVELLLTSGWCPFASTVLHEIELAVAAMPGVRRAEVEIVWDEAWSTDRLAPSAKEKLRFLPPPASVGDPTAYVQENWPLAAPSGKEATR